MRGELSEDERLVAVEDHLASEVTYDLAAAGSLGAVPRSTGRVAAASARRLARLGATRLA